jgi:hypothetical protein
MSDIRTSHPVRFTAMLVALTLSLGALVLVGCGGTVESPGGPSGTGAPEGVKYAPAATRTEVLSAVTAAGWVFDANMVSVIETDASDTVVVRGPLTNSKTKEKAAVATVVKGKGGTWAVTATK